MLEDRTSEQGVYGNVKQELALSWKADTSLFEMVGYSLVGELYNL